MARKLLSIITPVYNEQENVVDCYETVRRILTEQLPEYDYEHIFCDNASTDQTVNVLRELAGKDSRVKVICNARNVGPFCSTFNGLMSSSGDAVVVLLAVDLQDPPELIPEFVRRWEQGYEVVHGIRQVREEGRLMRSVRRLYYWTVSKLADIRIPQNVGEFQLVDRVIVEALRSCEDHYPYLRGMIAHCGFRTTGVPCVWKARKRGFSKHRFYDLIDSGLNGLISFTSVPLRLGMLTGFTIAGLSILYALVMLVVQL